ncbi:MAG: hypothetical protein ACYTHM_22385 [Planctomycetota bacterium]|jgi:hypothetical protein
MRIFLRFGWFPLFLLGAAGCSSLTPDPPLEDPRVKAALSPLGGPLPHRVGVWVDASAVREKEERFGHRFPPDRVQMRSGLVELLTKAGLFAEVVELSPRVTGTATPEAKAREMGLTLLVRLIPEGERVAYVERNHLWWPSLILWFLAWFPSWVIADETYHLEVGALVEVIDLKAETTVGRFGSRGSVVAGLNDVERGFHLLGIFRVPFCLSRSDFRTVRRKLTPRAQADFQVAFLLRFAEVLKKIPPPGPGKTEGEKGKAD